jgi:AhpD family alkylhydroperoxidase
MRMIAQLGAYGRVFGAARRNRLDLLRWLGRRPQLLMAVAGYEVALLTSARVDARLKALAELKAAALINCEFCLDIGSALSRAEGLTDRQLRALPSFRTSEEFNETEKLVLELAEAMTRSPTEIGEDLRDALLAKFSRVQLAELAAAVAWENHRGRLNQALGVQPAGFSEGAFCAVREQ